MSEILNQLGHLFVQTIPTVIFVFLLFAILDRSLFRPLTAILKQREELTAGALDRAREQAAQAEAKARQYEAALQAARQEVYRLREAGRRSALGEREKAVQQARADVETQFKRAQADLAGQVELAKKELQPVCQVLAQRIAETVLGNGRPAGRQEGLPQ